MVISDLPLLIDLIVSSFANRYWSSCLDCVGIIVEALGDAEQFRVNFHELLKHLTLTTVRRKKQYLR